MRLLLLSVAMVLSGCAEMAKDMAEMLGVNTSYTAPYLAAQPQPSGCDDARCQQLDRLEIELYSAARSGRIRWVQLVDTFYAKRTELFPDSDDSGIRELRAYQRVLAEQLDGRRITESQWVYLQEKKIAELQARNHLIQNTRPRATNCTTRNVGTAQFPQYQTQCY